MRVLLAIVLLIVGIAVGATVPGVSTAVQRALTAAWVPTTYFTTAPEPTKPAADPPKGASAAEEDEPEEKDSDAHAGHRHGGGHAGQGREGEEAEEGTIRMRPDQISGQDIKLAMVEGGTLARHLLVPGTITPDTDRIAKVPARVVGTVAEMRKRLGESVDKGEVVAVLDSREVADAKSEYLTTQVQAELQKINFERQQKLITTQATAQIQYDQARATNLEAQLRHDLARQKLSALGLNASTVAEAAKRDEGTPNTSTLRRYELRSPLAGRIVERKVDVGTAVGKEGDPADVYTVADLSTVWIELAVPTTELAKVKEGARVVVTPSQGDTDKQADGKVIFVSPVLNQETRSARVIVALPNKDMAWRPGTFVTAELEIAQDKVDVRIPKSALQTVEGKRVVFVRTEEGFERREVELGRSDDDSHEVTAGLKAGEEIAVANSFLLKAELGKAEADHDH